MEDVPEFSFLPTSYKSSCQYYMKYGVRAYVEDCLAREHKLLASNYTIDTSQLITLPLKILDSDEV